LSIVEWKSGGKKFGDEFMSMRTVMRAIGVVAVLLVAALAATSWWRGRPERHLDRAMTYLEAGEPDEALRWLDLPERSPRTGPRALLTRARAEVERGRPSGAVGPLDQIDPEGPLAAELAYWKGRTLEAAGQTLRAASWFRESLRRRPEDVESLRWLAATSYELGDISSAVEALETLAGLRPDDAPAWRTLGLIHRENAEFEQARDAYRRALVADEDQPDVRLELAGSLMELSEHVEAIGLLEGCRGKVDESARASKLARCLYEVGRLGEARQQLDLAMVHAPGHPSLLAERARIDLAEGRTERALEALDRALSEEPVNAESLYLRSQALRRLGRPDDADRDLARSRELVEVKDTVSGLIREADRNPGDPEVRYRLGTLCHRLNDPEMAAAWFQAALACDPNHDAARRALLALGQH
jgi:tetratricopeptide (TPR) repeat protein